MNRDSYKGLYAALLAVILITIIMEFFDAKAKDYTLATLVGVFSWQLITEIYTFYDRYIKKK